MFKTISTSFLLRLAGVVSAMIISIIIGRYLGAAELGIWASIRSALALIMQVSFLGTQKEIVRLFSLKKQKNEDTMFLLNTIFVAILTGIITSTVLFSYEEYTGYEYKNGREILLIALFGLPFQITNGILASALIGKKKLFIASLGKSTLLPLVNLLLIFILGLGRVSLLSLMLLHTTSKIITTLVLCYCIRPYISIRKAKIKFSVILDMVRKSQNLFVVSIADIAFSSVAILILTYSSTSEDVGYFNVAIRLLLIISLIQQVLNGYFSPKITELYSTKQNLQLENVLLKSSKLMTIISIGIMLFFFLFGVEVLSIWGPDFVPAYLPLLILTIGFSIDLSSGITSPMLYLTKKSKELKNVSITSLFLIMFFGIYFTSKFGLIGLALVVAVTKSIEAMMKTYFIKKQLGISVNLFAKWFIND